MTTYAENTTLAIYLGTDIIYSHLTYERLMSVLYSLVNVFGENLSDYTVVQNGTNNSKSAEDQCFNFHNSYPFDNSSSLRDKIDAISNQ